jgi:uncharacterized repeat protein (TIGR01451 family)
MNAINQTRSIPGEGSRRRHCCGRWILLAFIGAVSFLHGNPAAAVQQPDRHYLYDYQMPPGEIAWRKTLMRQAGNGYFQPVRLAVPDGTAVSVYSEGTFQAATGRQNLAGMMVGHIYRLKVTAIPGHAGREVYPSVEILGRLFPPAGYETRVPVPIHIPLEDIEPALDGNLVTRVIYLENPRNTIPENRTVNDQAFFDVAPGQDPLRVAEKFGRPMAIVRIGSRIPDQNELDGFGFGTPPMRWFESPIPQGPTETAPGIDMTQPCPVAPWPDELLFDGGDRGLAAAVRQREGVWEVNGLDSEDTIGHFDTLDGSHIIDASNRVQIYAPRFSAIRKIDLLAATKYTQEIGDLQEQVETAETRRKDLSSTTLQNLQPLRNRSTIQARGVEDMTRGVQVDNTTQVKRASSSFRSWEDLRLMKTGHVDNREKGRLAIAMTRANSWENNVSAQSTDGKLQLLVVDDAASVREAVQVRTEFNRPALRIVKIASVDVALPGDEIDFTIRFDNAGDQPIGNVTIMDNLTSRLEYIEDSAECSLAASFIASPNNSGSQTLSWEITDPLKIGSGGIIRFRCRVR